MVSAYLVFIQVNAYFFKEKYNINDRLFSSLIGCQLFVQYSPMIKSSTLTFSVCFFRCAFSLFGNSFGFIDIVLTVKSWTVW